ncbi:uncharacterized protein B0H64DRAFT_72028 [Chaetomium fimeti]|uniref:Uncharacterized protein n=1 Tax=Chaetomium fimeti TaxID=1854472 RepID=A0AAE0LUU0_9PEZI|nr:hypothetical protein B0H64DRAFT_72028 [Chaetomium fimeti]
MQAMDVPPWHAFNYCTEYSPHCIETSHVASDEPVRPVSRNVGSGWSIQCHSNILGQRLGGGIDRTADLERRDWHDLLLGHCDEPLWACWGSTAKRGAWKPGRFPKHRLDGLCGQEREKRREEGLVEQRERQSRCPVGHATVASVFSVADNGQMAGALTRAAGYEHRSHQKWPQAAQMGDPPVSHPPPTPASPFPSAAQSGKTNFCCSAILSLNILQKAISQINPLVSISPLSFTS